MQARYPHHAKLVRGVRMKWRFPLNRNAPPSQKFPGPASHTPYNESNGRKESRRTSATASRDSLALLSAVGDPPQAASGESNQSPKRKCGVSLSANPTPPIARDWVRGARQAIPASFAAEGPYASLLLVAAVRERAMAGKTEQERPLNKGRQKRRKAKMIRGSYGVEQGLSPVFSATISSQAENPRGPAR